MASVFPVENQERFEVSNWTGIKAISGQGASNGEQVTTTILKKAMAPTRPSLQIVKARPANSSTDQVNSGSEPSDADGWLMAFLEEGHQARAEELARRLELAVDALLESIWRDSQPADDEKLDVLFDLYEREILTRDQVRRRGNLEPAEFHEALRFYRQRQTGR